MAVENGPRAVGAVAWSSDDARLGVMGCRMNGGGEEGGVRPEPEGGSSAAGDKFSGGESDAFLNDSGGSRFDTSS